MTTSTKATVAEPPSAAKATRGRAAGTTGKVREGFTDEERAAMTEPVRELKGAARRRSGSAEADGERDLLAKISEMAEPDRSMAERLHAIIKQTVPSLSSRTWYGMPAYAKDGNLICFFQTRSKFKTRYATLGFSDKAALDDGNMWPTTYALTELTPAEEAKIIALVKRAVK